MLSPVLLSPLCLSLSQLLPLKALQTHLPHTSEWDVLQFLTGPIFPPLPIQGKKNQKHHSKNLGMFLKRRRRGILELRTGNGSVEQIFAMSCVRIREGCESKSWWCICRRGFVLQSCGVSSPHSSSPLTLRDLLVTTGYKCWDMKGECSVVC